MDYTIEPQMIYILTSKSTLKVGWNTFWLSKGISMRISSMLMKKMIQPTRTKKNTNSWFCELEEMKTMEVDQLTIQYSIAKAL